LAPTEELNDIISGNKASILRQEAYFRKKQEQIEHTIKTYEAEKRGKNIFFYED
jgi:hypothetical protein